MQLGILAKQIGKLASEKSPALLTALGVTGTLTTAYLAATASFKAAKIIEDARQNDEYEDTGDTRRDIKAKVDLTWKLYVPAAASAALTVAAIICANQISSRREAALASAFAFSDKAFREYKEKVIEKVGPKKEQTVRDSIAEDHVKKNVLPNTEIIIINGGNQLCRDSYSGRCFNGDVEKIRQSANDINEQIFHQGYASLSEFWEKIGLSSTSESDYLGWNTDRKLRVYFSSALTEDNRAVLTVDFQDAPAPHFDRASY